MKFLEWLFIGLDGKNIFRTIGCIWVVSLLIVLGFWGLVIWALIKYVNS